MSPISRISCISTSNPSCGPKRPAHVSERSPPSDLTSPPQRLSPPTERSASEARSLSRRSSPQPLSSNQKGPGGRAESLGKGSLACVWVTLASVGSQLDCDLTVTIGLLMRTS
eukprot:443338-Prorocentrum_minimum.AAC.2